MGKLNLEAGVKAIFRKNNTDYQYHLYNNSTGAFDIIPGRSNGLENKQNVYSIYNTYQFPIQKWNVKAGFRIEQTVIDASFLSNQSKVSQNYMNLVPAIALNRKLNNISSLSLSFLNRMQRPGISQLNPFVDRSNPEFETSGNPALKPTFTNIIQAGYNRSKKTNVSVVGAFMFFNSLIGPVSTFDLLTGITHTTFQNMSKGRVLRSNIFINHPFSNKLNASLNTDVRYAWLTTQVNGESVDNSGLMAYFNVSTGYRFERGWRVNVNLTMNSPTISGPQTKVNGYTNASFSMNKEILKDKLTFTALISNPFTKYRTNKEERTGPDFAQLSESNVYFRNFAVGLNYRFGKLKGEIKKNRRNIVNDDLNNGS